MSKNIFFIEKLHIKYIVLIVFFAFLLRLLPIIFHEIKEPGFHEKNVTELEFYYDDVARSLIIGKGFVHSVNPNKYTKWKFEPGTPFNFVPPLYSIFLSLVYLFFGPNVLIGKIFTSLADSMVCFFIFFIGRKIFKNDLISLISAFLYAIYPLSILMSGILYYQIMMNLCLCWLIYLLLEQNINIKNGFWSGIAFGLSALAKPVTLPLILIIPFITCCEAFMGRVTFKDAIKWSLSFIIVGLFMLAPWTVRNYIVFNEFIPIQRGGPEAFFQGSKSDYINLDVDTLRIKYKDDFNIKDKSNRAIKNHIELLLENPLSYFKFLLWKFSLAWYNTEGKAKNYKVLLVQTPFLVFAFLGTIIGFNAWKKNRNWAIFGFIFYICAIQVIIFPLVRYSLVIMPLVMIVASLGVLYLINIKDRKNFIDNNFI